MTWQSRTDKLPHSLFIDTIKEVKEDKSSLDNPKGRDCDKLVGYLWGKKFVKT
jgi:hypothetical protein